MVAFRKFPHILIHHKLFNPFKHIIGASIYHFGLVRLMMDDGYDHDNGHGHGWHPWITCSLKNDDTIWSYDDGVMIDYNRYIMMMIHDDWHGHACHPLRSISIATNTKEWTNKICYPLESQHFLWIQICCRIQYTNS